MTKKKVILCSAILLSVTVTTWLICKDEEFQKQYKKEVIELLLRK